MGVVTWRARFLVETVDVDGDCTHFHPCEGIPAVLVEGLSYTWVSFLSTPVFGNCERGFPNRWGR